MNPLLYFNKIEYASAAHLLGSIVLPEKRSVRVYPLVAWTVLPMSGLAAVSEEAEVSHGVRTYSVKMSAALRCRPEIPAGAVALRLTDVAGRQWLIGLDMPPHPVCQVTISSGNTPAEESGYTLSAELKAPYGLLQIIPNA